jgi:WD repeat-containing protein 45
MNKEIIAVVLQDRIYVYKFLKLKLKDAFETDDNPDGIRCLSSKKDNSVLAFPDIAKDSIKVSLLDKILKIEAHKEIISCLSITSDGSKNVSASKKGNFVRIIYASTGANYKKSEEVPR